MIPGLQTRGIGAPEGAGTLVWMRGKPVGAALQLRGLRGPGTSQAGLTARSSQDVGDALSSPCFSKLLSSVCQAQSSYQGSPPHPMFWARAGSWGAGMKELTELCMELIY